MKQSFSTGITKVRPPRAMPWWPWLLRQHWPNLVGLGFFCFALLLQVFRVNQAPDILTDEAFYYSVGKQIALGFGLTEPSGKVFVWHPPLYMLLEAFVIKVFNLAAADPISVIYQLRLINGVAGAITVVLLFQIGRRLHGFFCGTVIAAMFCFDPYVQRINRRNMLETVATLFLVAGVYLYLRYLHKRKHGVAVLLVGLMFGLAILTKELLAVGLLIPLLYAGFYRRAQLPRALGIGVVALLVYGSYPLWMWTNGYGGAYGEMKQSQIMRFGARFFERNPKLNLSQPLTTSKLTLWENLATTLDQYITSYLVIMAAVGIMAWLVFKRRTPATMLIVLWAASVYGLVGLGVLFGRMSDQFFYFLIVPALVLVGIAITTVVEPFGDWWRQWLRGNAAPRLATLWSSSTALMAVLLVLFFDLVWNITAYNRLFVFRQDTTYTTQTQLQSTLDQYAVSYAIMIAMVSGVLWLVAKRSIVSLGMKLIWCLGVYSLCGFGLLYGSAGDQAFPFMIIPALVLVTGALITVLLPFVGGWLQRHQARLGGSAWTSATVATLATLVLFFSLAWNMANYTRLFVFGQDNSYDTLYRYVKTHVPEGSILVVGADIPNYIFPEYRIRFFRRQENLTQNQVRYVILSSKERWAGYNNVTPEFYDWVEQQGTVRFEQDGNTFWMLRLFELPTQGQPAG